MKIGSETVQQKEELKKIARQRISFFLFLQFAVKDFDYFSTDIFCLVSRTL